MVTVESILSISHNQSATCMYTREELETFSLAKLTAIYEGIKALGKRGPWKRNTAWKSIPKTYIRWADAVRAVAAR